MSEENIESFSQINFESGDLNLDGLDNLDLLGWLPVRLLKEGHFWLVSRALLYIAFSLTMPMRVTGTCLQTTPGSC